MENLEQLIKNLTEEIKGLRKDLKIVNTKPSTLLSTSEALRVLGLNNPRILTYLCRRGLLPRIKLSERTFKYRKGDCEALLDLCIKEGIKLTTKA